MSTHKGGKKVWSCNALLTQYIQVGISSPGESKIIIIKEHEKKEKGYVL
jgi:hypothetical protein